MNDESPREEPPRDEPAVGWVADPGSRISALADYLGAQRDAYTPEALRGAALAAGYTDAEVEEATALLTRREQARPVRRRAVAIVLVSYVVVWLLFATVYLRPPEPGMDFGVVLQGILTAALLGGLGLSALWLAFVRPDPAHALRATTILLALPMILLLGIAGLCVPFVASS